MAFPTIPSGTRTVANNQADTSATRTFPSLSSLTKNSGDLLIAVIVAYQSASPAAANAAFSGWSAGWTEFVDQGTTPASTLRIGAAYKWSTGSESGTISVTQAATITGHASMMILSIPGAHATAPPEGNTIVDATAAVADPNSLTPSWGAADTLWIAVGGNGETSATGSWAGVGGTNPTNYSGIVSTNTADTSTVGQTELAMSFRQLNAASENPAGFGGNDLSNARNSALVIAVRPTPTINNWTQPVNDTGTLSDSVSRVWAAKQTTADTGTLTDAQAKRVTRAPQADTGALADASVQSLYTPTGVTCRHFSYLPIDYIVANIGACSQTGAFTAAIRFRLRNKPNAIIQPLFYLMDASNASRIGLEVAAGGAGTLQARVGNVVRLSAQGSVGESSGWMTAVVTKAAGTVNPFVHLYRGGTWTHDDTGIASADQPAQDHIQFGRLAVTGATSLNGEIAVAGVWPVDLSIPQIETLDDNSKTLDWNALGPVGLWDFNQASVSTAVNDLTGNGATETFRAGTSVMDVGPAGWVYGTGIALTQSVGDTGTWSDALSSRPGKSLADPGTWSDASSSRPGKALADTGTLVDATSSRPGKALADGGTLADATAKKPGKAVADTATIADTVTHFWQSILTIADGGTWADAVAKAPRKTVADTGAWGDALNFVVAHLFTQSVPDTFAVTDAISRRPGKGLADSFSATDAFVKFARHAVADTGTWADNFSFGGGKIQTVADTFAVADAVLKAPRHPVADAATWADALARAPAKALADTATWSDASSRKPGKAVADTAALADALAKAPRKVLADALTIADAFAFAGGKLKSVSDTFTMADAILKAPRKPLADSFTVADALTQSVGKRIADALGISDLVIPAIPDVFRRIARLFDLTRATPARGTDATVAYNSDATTPARTTGLDATAYASGATAAVYASRATADAYETGIIVVETDLELT